MTVHRSRYNSNMSMASAVRLTRPDVLPPFRLTERDISLLALIARLRFPTSEQLARLDGGSQRGVRARLFNLFAHGYCDRPRQQYAYLSAFFAEGNRPLCYAITRKGARLLAEHGIAVDANPDWKALNRRATAPYLAHAIETAEAMIAFELGCKGEDAPHLIDHHQLLPQFPAATRAVRNPFRLSVTAHVDNKSLPLVVVPDRVFTIAYPDRSGHNFCLELDRATMDVNPRTKKLIGKSSIRKKLIGYHAAWQQKKHVEVWGFLGHFRVLTITPSEKRLGNMIEVQNQITSVSGLFLYSTPERIAQHGVLGPAWVTSKADGVSLLSSSTKATETTDA